MNRTSTKPLLIIAGIASAIIVSGPGTARAAETHFAFHIAYATYLGGNQWEQAREIIVHSDGSVLVGMQTCSTGLSTTPGAVQPQYAGDDPALGHGGVYGGDCYLARLSPDGRRILAATYFGGSKQERNVYGLALDRAGNVVLTSATRSPDAPTTPGCFQREFGGGPSDMLVAKLNGELTRLLWCTYVGGTGDDFPRGGLALDAENQVCVVGTSTSPNFPTTPGVLQPKLNGPRDSAIVKLKADGTGLVFGTMLGGSGEDDAIMGLRFDGEGNLHVAGHTRSTDFPVTERAAQPRSGGRSDAYLAKLSPDVTRLAYATYLSGSGEEFAEHRPWLGADGTVLLTGSTGSEDFPTTVGGYSRVLRGQTDGFLTRLSRDGSRFEISALLGGSRTEYWLMPTPDAQGHIYVVGGTSSLDFPVTADALQPRFGGGQEDAVIAVLSADGSRLLYATYLGGSGDDLIRSLALGPKGEVFLVGSTSSDDFPVTDGAVQTQHGGKGDAFVVKLVPAPARQP